MDNRKLTEMYSEWERLMGKDKQQKVKLDIQMGDSVYPNCDKEKPTTQKTIHCEIRRIESEK